jgi:hypothetical protein
MRPPGRAPSAPKRARRMMEAMATARMAAKSTREQERWPFGDDLDGSNNSRRGRASCVDHFGLSLYGATSGFCVLRLGRCGDGEPAGAEDTFSPISVMRPNDV